MNSRKSRTTLVDDTYDALIDSICSGELAPGERLNQDEIASRLNVSRQPVISAIAILKANGFAEDNGRRGVIVTSIQPADFRAICEFRAVVEPLAVSLSAARLQPHWQRESAKILAAGNTALDRRDSAALVRADMDFHYMLYRWSGNFVIQNAMQVNWQHIRRAMTEQLKDPTAAIPSWQEHVVIIDQLLGGEGSKAARTMKKHIDRAGSHIIDILLEEPVQQRVG